MSLWKDKYVIGLTGNIAVGKSLVRQMLQHLGAYPVDADGLAHQVILPGAPGYLPTVEMFGKIVLDENGHVNRQTLGAIVFTIPDALTRLEAITHPVINNAIMTLVSRATQHVIVIEAIKLIESPNLMKSVDAVWVVDASPEAQLKRLVERRKMPPEEARKRIAVQNPQADKLQKAAVVIRNDGNPEETWKQVQLAWNTIPGVPKVKTTATETEGIKPPAAPPVAAITPATQPKMPPVVVPPAAAAAQTPTPTPTPNAPTALPGAAAARAPQPLTGGTQTSIPVVKPAPTTPPPPLTPVSVNVRRGKPGETDAIAKFITRVSGKEVDRMDIMLAFGQKSYLLAVDAAAAIIGVVGWQVENLITRVDEIYLEPAISKDAVIGALISAIEDHSRDLQSEVAFIALPATSATAEIVTPFIKGGYQPLKMDDVKFPAWREAARELLNTETRPLMKQLRERIMKPI